MPASCCLQSNQDTGRLFNWVSGLGRVRHWLFGFESNQRRLLDGIRALGIDGATLLEPGCGAGQLHQKLLVEGAAHATGVDLSSSMLMHARHGAARWSLIGKVDYQEGDFVALADELPEVDFVILDKVVCCYPDWQAMLDVAMAKARRAVALTYPLDRGMTRLGVKLMSRLLDCIHCRYRPYLHDPAAMHQHLQSHGFKQRSGARTGDWVTEIYIRTAED